MKSILFLVISFLSGMVFSQDANRILNFTDNDGLPQNKIKKILKDDCDYIWIGTQNGVAKFNGYSFKTYQELNGNEVIDIYLSGNNSLWIGTHRGLYKLDRKRDQFDKVSLGDIRDICSSASGLYFITPDALFHYHDGSITKFNVKNSNLRQLEIIGNVFYLGLGNGEGLISGRIHSNEFIKMSSDIPDQIITSMKHINGSLWVGTNDGKVYRQSNGGYRELKLSNKYSTMDFAFQGNALWIATDGNGLFRLDPTTEEIEHFYDRPNNQGSIRSNSIQTLLSFETDDLWVGTYDAGLFYLSFQSTLFDDLSKYTQLAHFNLSETATACFEDSRNNLWLGTQNGFMKVNMPSGETKSMGFDWCQKNLGGSKILAIQESTSSDIWIGSYDGGLGRFSSELNHKATYFPFTNGKEKAQNISAILPYDDGKLLINSMYNSIAILDEKTAHFSSIPLIDEDTTDQYQTQAIRQFEGETYAYLVRKDLCKLDKNTQSLVPVFTPPDMVNDFYKNADDTFWLATRGEGLILTNSEGNVLKRITVQEGLASNFLLRIEKDKAGSLWVTSISGLSRISNDGEIKVFDNRHGLPSKEFTPFVSTQLRDNDLLFGTVRGFVRTNLKKEATNLAGPKVHLSDITFQNKSIKEIAPDLLSSPIEKLKEITLPFDKNSFTLHFYNDDYNLPKFNTFSYRMSGLEKEWISLNENTQTTYTNLLPGSYQFQVKSASKYGDYADKPTTLGIVILPPWYLNMWAFSGYVIFAVLVFYLIYRIVLYRAHMKKELEFSDYKMEAMKELNEKKLRFFTNITHDFKTPLTLISAPLENIAREENLSSSMRKNIDLIKRNSDRLHHLIIDLLDFRKTSSSNMLELEVSKTDISRFIEDLYEPFKSACELKEIHLTVDNQCKVPVYFDNEKVKRIMWNLLSNGLKYTPKGGVITLSCKIEAESDRLKFSVKDSGQGLSEEEIERLFDRYYHHKPDNEWSEQSFGLGMAIVKGLVTSHRGEITVNSSNESGSDFQVLLPYKADEYTSAEFVDKPRGNYQFIAPSFNENGENKNLPKQAKYNLPTLLIAEDNVELNDFLVTTFSANFKVISCYDGMEALEIAQKKSPDVIISDVMMPKMDGYEFCEQIKSNINSSHIPLILLTANSSLDQQVEGMKHGADVYITKPFKTDFLMASVNSVLENRRKLREKFQFSDKINENLEGLLSDTDQKFMNQLQEQMQLNIDNTALSIEQLSEAMNCSKSSLIRKVKALAGLTPMAYLRTYRLNTAHELLTSGGMTVSEASYKTGFSDPNYFATCFKKQFGKNPSKI